MSVSLQSDSQLAVAAIAGQRTDEPLLRAIAGHSRDIIMVLGRDGTIAYQNPHAEQVLGYPVADVRGRPAGEYVHPLDRARVEEQIRALIADPSHSGELRSEFRLCHRDGNWRWFEAIATNLLDDPAVAGILLNARDITERKQAEMRLAESEQDRKCAEEALQKSEWRYRTVAEFTPGFVQEFEIDAQGRLQFIWASDGFEHIIGVPVEQVKADGTWQTFFRPDELPNAAERGARLQRGEPTRAEVCIVDAHGEERWLEIINRPVGTSPQGVTTIIGLVHEVTARRRAEERLAGSEEQFRLALENAPIGIALARPDGRCVQVNRRLCELLGYTAAELFELEGLCHLTHPQDLEADRLQLAALREGSRTFCDVEKRLIRRDGSEVLTTTHIAAIRDAEGRLLYLLSEIEDVSAQRSIEAALRKSETLLRAVTENVPDLLLLLGLDLRIQFANRTVTGLSPAELAGRSVLEFVPAADREAVRAVYERAIATQAPQVYEVRDVVSGETHWFENRIGPVIQDGRIVSLTVASSEITARRRGEEALRMQGRILDSMREGVFVLDGSSTIRLVNPALARLTGYDPRELIGRSGHILTRRARNEYLEVQADLERRLALGEFVDLEFECVRRDGSVFTAACVVTPIEIGGVRHRLGVLEDITQRRVLEREIIDIANREQRRIGSDLHDGLGQELTGVALMLRGLTARLRKEGAPAAVEAEEIVALVNSTIDSARSLARGLSPVSIERGGLPFAMRALCSRAQDMYGVEVRFRSKVWPQLTLDTAACNHLYRIAQEAVTNAVKHGRATEVIVDLQATGENVHLTITDNGQGLPPGANLAQGMGLKIMRYRASMVGGVVEIGPAPGAGTRVTMTCGQASFGQAQPAFEEER